MEDKLGDRMKSCYENASKQYLVRRKPVIIRLDGRAFHTFTKGFKRPYDEILHKTMNETMKYLCENIQGCKLGYTQSDEITLLLTDYDNMATDAWFGYNVQKICSVAASMATLEFNRRLYENWAHGAINERDRTYIGTVYAASLKGATFDARCFSIPEDEVTNCFIWRQQDAIRNAVQMLGRTYFSHKQLLNKSCSEIQDMLLVQHNINFNDMPTEFKRGTCCYRTEREVVCVDLKTKEETCCIRSSWVLDTNIPVFTQDRDYIEQYIHFDA